MASAGRIMVSWITTLIICTVCLLCVTVCSPIVDEFFNVLLVMLPSGSFVDDPEGFALWVRSIFNVCMFIIPCMSIIWAVLTSISHESDSYLADSPFGNV